MKNPPLIIIQLVHIAGPMKGEIQEFSGGEISIGRDPSCTLIFPADLTIVSRKHAHIIREGNQFKLVDTSSNGTFVNGKRVEEAYLQDGDVMDFAEGGPKISFLSEIREGEAAVSPSPAPREEYTERPQVQPAPEPVEEVREPEKPEPVHANKVRPQPEQPREISIQKVKVPLVIQYGPTLRSFNELPVTIGKSPKSDFFIDSPSIYDLHAQVFFSQDHYWIKDLTGQKQVHINMRPVDVQHPLDVNDEVSLSSQGPVFRFLGQGRLAEVEEAPVEEPGPSAGAAKGAPSPETPKEKVSGKILSRFKKYIG
jgi:pSer/pThr/pTyr-binding forkhead associated (FHA) protein